MIATCTASVEAPLPTVAEADERLWPFTQPSGARNQVGAIGLTKELKALVASDSLSLHREVSDRQKIGNQKASNDRHPGEVQQGKVRRPPHPAVFCRAL